MDIKKTDEKLIKNIEEWNNRPITYENKMKDRDNEFLYDKCVKQYHCIMNYQFKMREYKDRIKELEEENEKLREELDDVNITKDNYVKLINRVGELEERINKAIEYIHNHQPVFRLCSKEQLQEWFEKEYYVELLKILENGGENGKL